MKETLNFLLDHKTLSKEKAREVLTEIAKGEVNDSQMAAFLTIYMMRSITVEELAGFRDAMLDLCIATDLSEFDPIDLCGTGGDGKDTFNISTLSSFVVAGAGVNVAKHGNYGVSSACGSSNVMEYLGVNFTNDRDTLRKHLDKAGICIMHAPLFHPAMKNVAPVRKALGVKTFFNMLGPMVNPAFPDKQLVGVFSLELARLYGYIYQQSGKKFTILHSLDIYDEISLTSPFKVISNSGEVIMGPEDLYLQELAPEQLYGGNSVEEAADIFKKVLNNEGTSPQNDVVIANSAMAIHCAKPELSYEEAVNMARESLESGRARQSFEQLLELQ